MVAAGGATLMNDSGVVWKETPWTWVVVATAGVMLAIVFSDGLAHMMREWQGKEEYSYGYLIPFITLFLIWQKKEILRRTPFNGSWAGMGVICVGVFLFVAGNLSVLYSIIQYSFLVVLAGAVLTLIGWQAFKIISVPLFVLAFMIPLPDFIYQGLSANLQLLSSQLGVWIIRLFGISVYLQGNVIDLGIYKLQVAEACSGLRYLFPLMTFGFITAYFYKVALWKRIVIFLSTIPITVLMNSIRIGVIGIMVNSWGESMAEGFLHDFEGWVVFMVCLGVLMGEMWLLARIGKDPRPLREVFGLVLPRAIPAASRVEYRTIPKPFLAAALLLVLVTIISTLLPARVEVVQPREEFASFPMNFGNWRGERQTMDKVYVDSLKFDDYILAEYAGADNQHVGLYAAYYASQRTKGVPHSPRACIPGDGWQITSLTQTQVPRVSVAGHPLEVNRVVIQKGNVKQLVYYWFQERGRVISSEYLVKWYLFWDAALHNRSDGALVRVTTEIKSGQDIATVERRLQDFVRVTENSFDRYIPD